jgi:cytochrome c oxidase subunit 2
VEPAQGFPQAEARFSQCVPCHGEQGQGRPELLAPPIAGMGAWYLESQLMKYRHGIRGAHFDDINGLRMKPMAMSLPTDEDVKLIAQYIAQLPTPTRSGLTMTSGNAEKGKALFVTCTACHGQDGGGNQALGAPAIAGLDDWYVVMQLEKFKGGVRGAHPKDTWGATMRAISMTLPDVQAMTDVATYIASMPKTRAATPQASQPQGGN